MGVFTYNQARGLLEGMGDDTPLAVYKAVKAMEMMSLQTLQNTRQGHLIDYEEGMEQPTQELETPPESSSRPRKKKRAPRN